MRIRVASECVHVTALALWLGAAVISGVNAAIVFPTIKAIDPRLPEYGAYSGEHWRIAGGVLAAAVFGVALKIEIVCGATAVVSAFLGGKGSFAGVWGRARAVGLIASMVVLVYFVAVLNPRMSREMEAFHTQARLGDNAGAAEHRAAFDRDHPQASGVLVAESLTVLLSLISAAAVMARRGRA